MQQLDEMQRWAAANQRSAWLGNVGVDGLRLEITVDGRYFLEGAHADVTSSRRREITRAQALALVS